MLGHERGGETVADRLPRCIVSGLRGGGGKTTVALGLAGAFRGRGLDVAPFKKGPDFIDPGWLTLAAGRPCRNLDAFLMDEDVVLRCFATGAARADLAVIEGNRGLHDGLGVDGGTSTAELAKTLATPIILVVDCTKVTRTAAALVLGCRQLDPEAPIAGVVLNRIAGPRHESVARGAIERYCDVPVLGAIPRQPEIGLAERHLGLVPRQEHASVGERLAYLADVAEKHIDLEAVLAIADAADALPPVTQDVPPASQEGGPRIGIVRDSAFHFYYPENLEALERLGAELVFIDALSDAELPQIDALYIGGGFPETHAEQLEANVSFRASLRSAIEDGLPVVAECGGLMYLSESIERDGIAREMVGVFPVSFDIAERPQGHGYTVLTTARANPYFPEGAELKGHEFRYARMVKGDPSKLPMAFAVERGRGFDGRGDGLLYKNVLASFTHFHAAATPQWAEALIEKARTTS